MRIGIQLYTAKNGTMIYDWTGRADECEWTDNQHGYADCVVAIPYPRNLSYLFYERVSGWIVVSHAGKTLYEGRFEDASINNTHINVTCFGAWRAFSDLRYTALWSDTRLDQWAAIPHTQLANRESSRFEINTESALRIAAQKDQAFDTNTIGSVSYAVPYSSSTQITVAQFDYRFFAPTSTWTASLSRYTQAYVFQSTIWTLTGSNATQTGSLYLPMSACDRLVFNLYYNQAATTLGAATNPVSTTLGTTTTDVSTTLGTTIAAGVRTVTPGLMTGITAGRKLLIGGTVEETITVTSTTATTFTATFAQAHTSADLVRLGTNTVTVTPASMANIAAGTNLDIGGSKPEVVTVTAVTSTTFTADFVNAHSSTDPVQLVGIVKHTPASMTGIAPGTMLSIGNNGAATRSQAETVQVLTTTTTSFIAEFQYPHASSDTVSIVNTQDSGVIYLEISNIRFASSTTNAINTTSPDDIFFPGLNYIYPVNTTNMQVGQRLFINSGASDSESIVIDAIVAGEVEAQFAQAHAAPLTIQTIFIQPSEIIGTLISTVSSTNPTQLNSSTSLIQNSGIDLLDEVYEDAEMPTMLERFASLGDTATIPNMWEIGVRENQLVYYRIRGSAGKTWYVNVIPDVSRSLDRHWNSGYAVYQDVNGDTVRGTATTDQTLVNRVGMLRRTPVESQTTNSTLAEIYKAAFLYDHRYLGAKETFDITELFDASGNRYPLWHLKAGDSIVIRLLPIGVSSSIDYSRIFRVDAVTFKNKGKLATVTPEARPPTLPFLLARANAGR